MADESVASIIPWHQPKPPGKTPAAKAKRSPAAKPRKRTKTQANKAKASAAAPDDDDLYAPDSLIAPDFLELVEAEAKRPSAAAAAAKIEETANTWAAAGLPAAPAARAAPQAVAHDLQSVRHNLSPYLLQGAALALALVGIAMNGWFAQSLGSSHIAGWMFLAIGVASDLVALVMPTCAARLWHDRHRATALAGWTVWAMTFVFAVTAGIGFASTNISEVALARSSRVTPAIQAAQTQLADATAARDRECKSGVGKFCREREAEVADRRRSLDAAMASVTQTADPQTEAAIKLVAWVTHGLFKPAADDFAMLRLVLLALLPQFGGILLMVGRRR
ncbi:conserved membrane hypothetical protein [Bradyrhizobium sp. STM 3843]|uniref:hypothetical protein n=1 Tax=Bradyrhizobium sp. STM 3843 TaxID=551947 RepID=UPI0002404FB6|nr:hypothetical protein [Bradyrhizobium sp. STM 3843]CCE09337.1 conserved membrane hypothetical protein [Bradyrhizobium sp. STM 3843]